MKNWCIRHSFQFLARNPSCVTAGDITVDSISVLLEEVKVLLESFLQVSQSSHSPGGLLTYAAIVSFHELYEISICKSAL